MVGSHEHHTFHEPIYVADFDAAHFKQILGLERVLDESFLRRLRSRNLEIHEIPVEFSFSMVFEEPVEAFLQYLKIAVTVASHKRPLYRSACIDEERAVFMQEPQVSSLSLCW